MQFLHSSLSKIRRVFCTGFPNSVGVITLKRLLDGMRTCVFLNSIFGCNRWVAYLSLEVSHEELSHSIDAINQLFLEFIFHSLLRSPTPLNSRPKRVSAHFQPGSPPARLLKGCVESQKGTLLLLQCSRKHGRLCGAPPWTLIKWWR
jgi:hypothetical protein